MSLLLHQSSSCCHSRALGPQRPAHRCPPPALAKGEGTPTTATTARATPAGLSSSSSSSSRRRRARHLSFITIARATADDDDNNGANDSDDDGADADVGPPPLPPPASAAALDAAALAAVDAFVRPGAVVGLGRGEMAQRAVAAIGRRIKEGRLGNVSVVPSAAATAAAAAFHGVPQQQEQATGAPAPAAPVVFFDEADQLDPAANAYLSGSRTGEAAHPDLPKVRELVERTLARGGEVVALPSSAAACVPRLNAALPVALAGATAKSSSTGEEGALAAWEETAEELDDIFLGDAELWRRPQDPQESANPRGGKAPLIQPDGTTLVDVRFYEGLCLFGDAAADYGKIQEEIEAVEGVVATGLFVRKATAAVVPAGEGEERPRLLVRGEGGALVEQPQEPGRAAA